MCLSSISFFLPISSSFSSLVSSQPYFPSTFLPYFLPYLLPFFPPYFLPDFLPDFLSIFFTIFSPYCLPLFIPSFLLFFLFHFLPDVLPYFHSCFLSYFLNFPSLCFFSCFYLSFCPISVHNFLHFPMYRCSSSLLPACCSQKDAGWRRGLDCSVLLVTKYTHTRRVSMIQRMYVHIHMYTCIHM